MNLVNRIGIFNNQKDTIADLKEALSSQFRYVQIEIRSSTVLFAASQENAQLVTANEKVYR